jgi:hypothetical protein
MIRAIIIATLLAVAAAGGCDNGCSGHGTCLQNGVCDCWDNWGMGLGLDSGDCSQRVCPFEFAWVDTPDKLGNRHKYAECSNRGICDRDTGECECFPGYEGKGCARTTCPNDCSGHGRCKYIEDLPYRSTPQQFDTGSFFPQKAHSFGDAYKNWDARKTRGCECDPEWGDVDCSKRMCMMGNDIMDQRENLLVARKQHTQHIQFVADNKMSWTYDYTPSALNTHGKANEESLKTTAQSATGTRNLMHGRTFALVFTSKLNETFTTIPVKFAASDAHTDLKVMFLAVEHALEALPNGVIDNVDVAGELRQTTGAWTSSESTTALDGTDGAALDGGDTHDDALYMNITFSGKNVQGTQNLLQVKHIHCSDGCTPKLDGLNLRWTSMTVREDEAADWNSYECGRRGKCDYSTGICQCFNGYAGLACGTITSLV